MGNVCCALPDDKASEVDAGQTLVEQYPIMQTSEEVAVGEQAGTYAAKGDEPTAEAGAAVEEERGQYQAALDKLVIVFEDKKGVMKTVEFATAELGFEYGRGGGCCGPAPGKAPVKVKKVIAKQQAALAGVLSGAIVRQVNGKDVADAEQLCDLLANALAALPAVVPAPTNVATPAAPTADAAEPAAPAPEGTEMKAPESAPATADDMAAPAEADVAPAAPAADGAPATQQY